MNGMRTGRASFMTTHATKRRTIASAPLKNLSSLTPASTFSFGRPSLRRSFFGQGGGRGAEKRFPGRFEAVRHAHRAAENASDPSDIQMLTVAVPVSYTHLTLPTNREV